MGASLPLRLLGTILYGVIGWEVALVLQQIPGLGSWHVVLSVIGMVVGFVAAPWLVRAPAQAAQGALRQIATPDLMAGVLGGTAGLGIAALLSVPVAYLPDPFGRILPLVLAVLCSYLGAVLLVGRQSDLGPLWRGLPASRGSGENSPPLLLDTSVIIDGRIDDVARTGFLLGTLTVPRFVLNELQSIADSADSMRRGRGRRGLEVLDRLQNMPEVVTLFTDLDPKEAYTVDDKLIRLALQSDAAILTTDYNLNRIARLQGVRVLNINELANAVKSVYLPGEVIPLKIIQEGKEQGQGVGYLADGTMVVVENGRRHLNNEVPVQVTKVLQTNAGRLIFATPE
ncbi:MAG: PIN/TRAM domain-containing protein [Caldilinea sp.]|jgi:uncharacterized protein YacL